MTVREWAKGSDPLGEYVRLEPSSFFLEWKGPGFLGKI